MLHEEENETHYERHSFGKKERRKVDRVFANHYLSQPPVSRNFQRKRDNRKTINSFSIPFYVLVYWFYNNLYLHYKNANKMTETKRNLQEINLR